MKKNLASYNWVEPELFGQTTKCLPKLPEYQMSDLILKSQAHQNSQYFVFGNSQLSEIKTTGIITSVVSNQTSTFETQPIQNVDTYIVFVGKKEKLDGLTIEVKLNDEFFVINTPANIFIPSGVQFAYLPLSGEGLCFTYISKGNITPNPTFSSNSNEITEKRALS